MRNYKKALNTGIVCVGLFCLAWNANTHANTPLGDFGRRINQAVTDVNGEDIIFDNGRIVLTKSDFTRMASEEPHSANARISDTARDRITYLIEKKALIQEAKAAGYRINDEEYQSYVNTMKNSLMKAENREEILSFYEEFGGEDAYFQTMEESIRESMTARKYLDDKMAEYAAQNRYDIQDPAFIDLWNGREEQIREDALRRQQISPEELARLTDMMSVYLTESSRSSVTE